MLLYRKWLARHQPDKNSGKKEDGKSADIIKEYDKMFLADCYNDRVS